MTQCNAELHIGDDYGDNRATMHCQLAIGHDGPHQEAFERRSTPVTLTWWCDERQPPHDDDCDVRLKEHEQNSHEEM